MSIRGALANLANRIKFFVRPIYRRLPGGVQESIRELYRRTFWRSAQPTVKPAPIVVEAFDAQHVDEFLCAQHPAQPSDNVPKWLSLPHDMTIQCSVDNVQELQISLAARSIQGYDASHRLLVQAIFDEAGNGSTSSEVANLRIPPDNQKLALRIPVPKRSDKVQLRFEANTSDLEISNAISIHQFARGLSIIVGVYKEEDRIGDLLQSLSSQDVQRDRFEIVFVINGERDRSDEIIGQWSLANPDIKSTVLFHDMPSLSNARNVGMRHVQFSHLTFVDGDDTLSPGFVSSLVSRLAPEIISCSNIVNVDEDCADPTNSINQQLISARSAGNTFPPHKAMGMSTMSACKALPSFMARCVPFRVKLKNGEDTPFYSEIYARFPLVLLDADADPDQCVYFRSMRHGSMSRVDMTYKFYVSQRLDVIEALEEVLQRPMGDDTRSLIETKKNAQVDFAARYLLENTQDHQKAIGEIGQRNFLNFPWRRLKERAVSELVVSYCFPPFQDASSIVMAKRMFERGHFSDVISNGMDGKRDQDPRLLEAIGNYVANHKVLATPVSFAGWPGIRAFAVKAAQLARQTQKYRKRDYTHIYSRAQWCASHFAALLIKLQQPDLPWTAEFSDPLLVDVEGGRRPGDIDVEWLAKRGVFDALDALGAQYNSEETSLFYWCELCTIYFADELVFTNENQLEYMTSYLDSDEARNLAHSKATVSPHPIAQGWLSELFPNNEPKPANLNLAYFGSFYANRGAEVIFEALAKLTPQERHRTRFYIYSRQHDLAREAVVAHGLSDIVVCRPEIMYVDMIREMTKFDVLVVNDTIVGAGNINPFLPSKLADYLQSDIPILALYEAGSALNKRPEPTYRIDLSDEREHQLSTLLGHIRAATKAKVSSLKNSTLREPKKTQLK